MDTANAALPAYVVVRAWAAVQRRPLRQWQPPAAPTAAAVPCALPAGQPCAASCSWAAAQGRAAAARARAGAPLPSPACLLTSTATTTFFCSSLFDPQTLLFFAGFLIRFSSIPDYWKWYAYIDVLR